MEDDIDIEEHDVLDNPAIKNMFPDLSVIKKEILKYYEDVTDTDKDQEIKIKSEMQSQGQVKVDVQKTLQDQKFEILETKVEIIDTETIDVIRDEENFTNIKTYNESTFSSLLFGSNKIILGSKPYNTHVMDEYETFFERQLTTIQPKVLVDNMQPYLERSGRYCMKCTILFPNMTALDFHNETIHSAIKQEGNKKTTRKKQNRQNRLSLLCTKARCNLCKGVLSTRGSLHRHLKNMHDKRNYKISEPLLTNAIKCNLCCVTFSRRPSLLRHYKNSHGKSEDKISQSVTQKRNDGNIIKKIPIVRSNRRKMSLKQSESDKINRMIKHVRNKIKTNEQSPLDEINNCFHCSSKFTSPQALIEHLYQVLSKKPDKTESLHINENKRVNTNNSNNSKNKKDSPKSKQESKKCLYYRCHICSYYFKDTMSYVAHLGKNHKITTHIKLNNVPFDTKCKYCQEIMVDIFAYNSHLKEKHGRHYISVQKTNNDSLKASDKVAHKKISLKAKSSSESEIAGSSNLLVLKSTIFKCKKCDIFFLTARTTIDHSDHMELLINWKCAKCYRIFKKNDEELHEKQHLYSEKLNVLDLPEAALRRVLYSCPKCTVHFNEDNFIKHYPTCGSEAPNSTYCNFCDILIDDAIGETHKWSHEYDDLKSTDFPIIVTDIIQCSPNEQGKGSPQKINNLKRKLNDKEIGLESTKKKPKFNNAIMFDMTYCTTCKCYVTDSFKRKVHLQGNCGHLGKHICKSCGLVITMGSYRGHKRLHNQNKNLKLQDFRFYELQSGKQIYPLIPEFPKCVNCKVCFVSKMASLNHDCTAEDYLTCHTCEVKLSEAAFKFHMVFHNYTNDCIEDMEINTTLQKKLNTSFQSTSHKLKKHNTTTHNSNICKSVNNEEKNTSVETKTFISETVGDEISNEPKKEIRIADVIYPLEITDVQSQPNSNQKMDNIQPVSQGIINIKQAGVHALCQSADSTADLIKESINMITMGLLFTCKNCSVSVDSYDRAVDHCQRHYIKKEWQIESSLCPICNFNIEKQCLANHQKLHNVFKYGDTNIFKEFKFDAFYIKAKSDVWIKHVFGSLQQAEIDQILSNSIYKYEYKIKMDVIQDGPPDLTVYKCEKCRCFINETSLNRHAENACFKVRKHPCTCCGLAFISSLARIEHEKIHKRPNISAKSYRIVTFNREKDKTLNSTLSRVQYVLYQCRSCNVTVDKSQTKDHKCNHNDRKKCMDCGLLVNIDQYELHQLRHKDLSYFTKHVKIVMFGEEIDNVQHMYELASEFDGEIFDYTFYKCAKCHICVKNINSQHTCSLGSSRTKCARCDLYFMTGKFKYHRKFHEIDPDFILENMRIKTFNSSSPEIPSLSTSQINEILKDSNIEKSNDSKAENVVEEFTQKTVLNDVVQKTANIYKCKCSLCFLDEISAFSHHDKSCNPRMRAAVQKCSKCDLVFSPVTLFRHLLLHHGDKKLVYNFNVIDIDKLTDQV